MFYLPHFLAIHQHISRYLTINSNTNLLLYKVQNDNVFQIFVYRCVCDVTADSKITNPPAAARLTNKKVTKQHFIFKWHSKFSFWWNIILYEGQKRKTRKTKASKVLHAYRQQIKIKKKLRISIRMIKVRSRFITAS